MAQPLRFVDPDSISKYLHCSICTEVFTNPQRLPCEHIFCHICIVNWSRERSHCPQCRHKFNAKKLVRDRLASCLVDELKVKCFNNGCCWIGESADLQQHAAACLFHPSRAGEGLLSLMKNASGPSLISKLFERNPITTKQFLTQIATHPTASFLDLSDEENRSG